MEQPDSTEQERRARDIFLRAAEIHSPEARAAYLEGACQHHAPLRARVDALLGSHRTDSFLENAAIASTVSLRSEPSLTEAPGTRIGRYKLLEEIGQGGFGSVWAAEQREPVKRRVALKIIKLGMDSKQVVARFEAERQALALMDHPNIAKVLDAGTTDNGRPYFVMELVKGVPITGYCDQRRMGTRDRLDLFIKVCQAIQHAHQKGIIHRDIKPSNILVTLHDGVPVPKVIDFGIAKATQQELTDLTIYTQHHQFIGTPAYMSPEQAELSGLDIDTRSDIYSLGVLLYELLTGSTPFDTKELMQSGIDAMRKMIREQEPLRPSTKLSQTLAATGKDRPEQAASHIPLSSIEADLDWIVMKCLEKERSRRYDTPIGLAADLKRHLNHEPVLARPPSTAYRLQKAWRRNRLVFTAGAAIALALIVGIIGTTAGLVRAERERRVAQASQQEESRQREIAIKALEGERQQTARAGAARDEAEARAYASGINLAQQAVANENLGQAWSHLDRLRPRPGSPDRRGWEWRYLWQQCQSDAKSAPLMLSNRVNMVRVAPDGKWMAAASGDETGGVAIIDLSDPSHPRLVERLAPTVGMALAAISPQGDLLAFSCYERVYGPNNDRSLLKLWDTKRRQMVGESRLDDRCWLVSFSPDGKTVLTFLNGRGGGGDQGTLAYWRVPDLKRIDAPGGIHRSAHSSWSHRLAVARDWTALAFFEQESPESAWLELFDLKSNARRWRIPYPSQEAEAAIGLTLSDDGRLLLIHEGVTVDARVRILDAGTGRSLGSILGGHREYVSSVALWPDGKTLATASADQTIRLWDLSNPANPKPIGRPLQGHRSEVWGIAPLPDQRTLVSAGKNGSILTWDIRRHRSDLTRLTLTLTNFAVDWKFTPDSRSIVTVDYAGEVLRWSGPDFDRRELLVSAGGDWEARLSNDGQLLARGLTNGIVQIWDLERRVRLKEFQASTNPVGAYAFRDGDRSLIVSSEGLWSEWDLADLRLRTSWTGIPGRPLLSPDKSLFFTVDIRDGRFLTRDLATGRQTVQTNQDLRLYNLTDAALSPNGKMLALSSETGVVRLFERETLRPIETLRGFLLETVFSVCFSPDGRRMATSSGGREALRLWDNERQLELVTLDGGSGGLFQNAQFSPDGNILGAVAADNTLRLWRAPSWAEVDQSEANRQPQMP